MAIVLCHVLFVLWQDVYIIVIYPIGNDSFTFRVKKKLIHKHHTKRYTRYHGVHLGGAMAPWWKNRWRCLHALVIDVVSPFFLQIVDVLIYFAHVHWFWCDFRCDFLFFFFSKLRMIRYWRFELLIISIS